MKSKITTKHALITSVMALFLCVAMLIGSTFAWFTDTASTGVNTITSGTLDVDIVDATNTNNSLDKQTMNFVNQSGSKDILWEPGVTFRTTGFKIKNNGNLALKYKLALNGVTGTTTDASGKSLLDVITFSVVTLEGDTAKEVDLNEFEGHLKATEIATEVLYIQGHMEETAGNEYQGLELTGLGITVKATQDTVEADSKDNKYDEKAEYPEMVASVDSVRDALATGKSTVIFSDDITVEDGTQLNVTKDTSINFNGKTLEGTVSSGSYSGNDPDVNLVLSDPNNDNNDNTKYSIDGNIVLHEGGGMTQYAAISAWKPTVTIESGRYTHNNVVIHSQVQTSNPDAIGVVVNGGTFDGKGAASVIADVIGSVVVNDGNFNAYDDDGNSGECVYLSAGSKNVPTITTINGGMFTATKRIFYVEPNAGYTQKIYVNGGDFKVNAGGELIQLKSGDNAKDYLEITGGTFNVDPSAYVPTGYAATESNGIWTVTKAG